MTKNITVLLLLLISFNSYAQDVALTKSDIFKDSKRQSSLKFSLESDNGNLVTIREYYGGFSQRIKGYYIQHFDTDLKLLNEVNYEVNDKTVKNAFIKDNQLHLIEYVFNKKSEKIAFNAVSADLKDLKFSTKEILSFSEKNQTRYFGIAIFPIFISNFSQFDSDHTGEVVMSDNNNYFVINFDIKNKEQETHKIFVFDSNFNKVYDQLIQKEIRDKDFTYENVDIDDTNGTVYFLGKVHEKQSKESKKKGEISYHYELYKVDAKGQTETNLKDNDKFISSLELVKSKDGLSCIGFYGQKNVYRINGVTLFNLDSETLTIEKKKFTPFSEEFLNDKYGNKEGRKKRKKEKGIKNIDFKGVYVMGNGDIVLNAEEYYTTIRTTTSANGGIKTRTVYHFDDIMSIKLDKDGNLKWARNINKRQTGFETSSFTSIPVAENSYFFINCSDNIKKLSADRISFKQTKAKKSNLYMIKINQDGDFDFKKIIDDRESKVHYIVNNGNINLDNQTVILPGKKGKNTRILKLRL